MFIQNAVLKSISAEGLTFPLSEGSVVSVGGVTGIVPTTLGVRPATNRIYVAVAGTIDMTSDANKGVTFTEEQIKALGGDFNFVPAVESGGGLPSTSGKSGKVLSVNSSGELEWAGAVLPEASGAEMGKVATVNSNGKWYKGDIPNQALLISFSYDSTEEKYVSNSYPDLPDTDKPIIFVFDDDGIIHYSLSYYRYSEENVADTPIWKVLFEVIDEETVPYVAVHFVFTWYVSDGNEVLIRNDYTNQVSN